MSFTANVSSGAVVTGETIAGGEQQISAGGVASNTNIRNAGLQYISSGGVSIVTAINSGGSQYVNGSAIVVTINSGGSQFVDGSVTSTIINSGGSQYVDGKATSTTINSGGIQEVDFYGSATRTIINSGGIQTVSYFGMTTSTVINNNGGQYVSSGGTAIGTLISSGGSQEILSSGIASNAVISAGGVQFISSGGTANNTAIYSGGDQMVEGNAVGTTVNSGGVQFVSYGGIASRSLVKSGGELMIGSGCSVTGFTISSGGILGWDFDAVFSGKSNGVAISSSTVNSSYNLHLYDGDQYVLIGETADSTVINSGGSQYVQRGGTADNCTVNNSGIQYVSSGGVANSTVINAGGSQDVSYHGTANDTVINAGGSQHISSGGTANNILVGAGGDLVVSDDGQAAGTLTVDGGHVELEDSSILSSVTNVNYELADAAVSDPLITIDAGTLGTGLTSYSLDVDNTEAGSYSLLEAADLSGMADKTFTVNWNDLSVSLQVGSTYTFANGNSVSLAIAASTVSHLLADVSGDFIAPSVPAGLTQKTTGPDAALAWTNSTDNSGIKQYDIEYSTSNLFIGATTVTNTVNNYNLNLPGLTGLTTFYWRVQAEDNYGNLSGWSAASSFIATPTDRAANTWQMANDISQLDNWVGLDDPADCYKLTLTIAANVSLSLTGLTGDVNLSLLDATGKVLKASANKGTASESIANQLLTGGTYYVKVAPVAGVTSANYTLTNTTNYFPIDTAPNTWQAARDITLGVDNWVGFGDPADVYALTMTRAGTLTLGLTGLSGNAPLSLLDATGKILKTAASKGTANESITQNLLAGNYFVKVAPGAKVTAAGYTLTNTTNYFPVDTAGNTWQMATDITHLDNWVGFGDPADVYALTMDRAGTLTLGLTGLSGGANLSLLSATGAVLKTTAAGTAAESITQNLLAGNYFVKVAPGAKVTAAGYTLTNTTNYFPVDTAGNTWQMATDITHLDNWVGFGDSADVYALTMTGAGTLALGLTGLSGGANLSLLNSSGKVLKTTATGTADESITQTLQAGNYFVKVAPGAKVTAAGYTLTSTENYLTAALSGNNLNASAFKTGSLQLFSSSSPLSGSSDATLTAGSNDLLKKGLLAG